MGIRVADTAGFCMGVRRAVEMVLEIAQRKGEKPIYTYGPLIHNPQTIDLLKQRGIIPVDDLDSIECRDGETTLIVRAHGISPQERERIRQKGLKIIDATCPKVAHVQAIIRKHAAMGYTILIVGDSDHPEVNGLLGYSQGKGIVVGSVEDVQRLPSLDKICVVAQTTQSKEVFSVIVDEIRKRFPLTVVYDTICDSTEKRQKDVKKLAAEMDAVFIVGGKNSANTKRLAAISELQGKPTYHIETADELKNIPVENYENIGVSAGASTPNWIIERVVDSITNRQGARKGRFGSFFRVWVLSIQTDIYSAIGAGCLSFAGMALQRLDIQWQHICIASLYVYAIHTLNRLLDRKTSTIIGSFREDLYRSHEKTHVSVAVFSLFMALIIAFFTGLRSFLLLFIISILGVLYNVRFFPRSWRFQCLKDIPGSKNVFMASAWGIVTAVLPRIEIDASFSPGMVVAFLFVFGLVFLRSAVSDVFDIQNDKFIGRETIPVLIGKERTEVLLKGVLVVLSIMLVIAGALEWTSTLSFALVACGFFIWIYFMLYDRRSAFSRVVQEGILETTYILAGLCSLAWVCCS